MSGSGKAVPSKEFVDLEQNMQNADSFVNSTDLSFTNRTSPNGNTSTKTLSGLVNDVENAIENTIGKSYIGVWTIGVTTFNFMNEYAEFNGVTYKPKGGITLPYVAQTSSPLTAPDSDNVEPFSDINSSNLPAYTDLVFSNAQDLKSGITNGSVVVDMTSLQEGTKVHWMGYYTRSDGGSNWGRVRFGAHADDGGSIFSIDANTYIEANLKGKSINVAKFGSTGVGDSLDATSRLTACFDYCNSVDVGDDASYGIPAKLPIGEHYITSNITLPDGGLHGIGMSQSRILVDENITGDAVTMGDSAAGNLFRGSVRDLRIQARTNDFTGRCLRVNRPNQGAEVRNVYLYVGNGVGLGLKDAFNLGTYNVVITSRFNGNLPTDPSNALIGSGIEQIDGTEMNDLLFTRIDMRHLRHCLIGATSIANGTNTIKLQSCVIENIGNMLFNLDGWNVDFDNVYIENIYRNRDVAGEPVPVATVARGGAGRCIFSNGGILNLGLPNNNTISPFRWIEGDVEFNSAKLRNYGDNVDPIQKVTFSSSGILKAENSELPGGRSGIERKGTQDKSNIYPDNFKTGSEIYTPLYVDGWKCGGNLQAVGKPTAPQFAHYANLGICSVEGNIKTHHSVLTVDVTFYRYSLTSISCEFKKLRLHFLIRPNCTATITPFKVTTIEEVATSGVWGSNFESSIIARRRTPERTDPDYNNEYTFHYQIEVAGESGGTTENTSETNDVNAQIVWIYSSNSNEETPPNYTLYQQNGFVTA